MKKKSATRESRVELLESGSSTPGSTEHSDEIDSASVTTSSSSEVTAVAVRRDRGAGLTVPAAVPRPKNPAGLRAPTDTRDHLAGSAWRPTHSNSERAECDNEGFVGDEMIVASAQNVQRHPLEQQQQQQPASTSKVADSQTHCVSVELHSAPRELAGADTGNEWTI